MSIDTALGMIGSYVLVISALALGVERVMDFAKMVFKRQFTREPSTPENEKESDKARKLIPEQNRQRRVRVGAMAVGIALAAVATVDTFDILGMTSPRWFGLPILGWVLSGLAASRGSAFWHDIIELVRTVKETRRNVAEAGQK